MKNRQLHEEFLRGVPEFVIRQAVNDCADRIRQHVKSFVTARAESPTHARELMKVADATLAELDETLYQAVENGLWTFVQQV